MLQNNSEHKADRPDDFPVSAEANLDKVGGGLQ